MTDTPDPSEVVAQAVAGDDGEIGTKFQWRGRPLNPYSLHHVNAHMRMAWENMGDSEYAQMFIWLLLHKNGAAANRIRGEKAVEQAQFEAIEWAEKEGAVNKETAKEMVDLMQEIRADKAKAESIQPKSRGGTQGNP